MTPPYVVAERKCGFDCPRAALLRDCDRGHRRQGTPYVVIRNRDDKVCCERSERNLRLIKNASGNEEVVRQTESR